LFVEAGYNDLDLLKDANVDELKALFTTCEEEHGVKVKPPHQKRILKAFEDLKSQDRVEPAADDGNGKNRTEDAPIYNPGEQCGDMGAGCAIIGPTSVESQEATEGEGQVQTQGNGTNAGSISGGGERRQEAEEQMRKEAEEQVQKEAEEQVQKEAEEQVQKEAEEQVQKEAEATAANAWIVMQDGKEGMAELQGMVQEGKLSAEMYRQLEALQKSEGGAHKSVGSSTPRPR
jgi:hypothetical protein